MACGPSQANLNEGSTSDLQEDLDVENFHATVHGSFFLHLSEDGNVYHVNDQGNKKRKIQKQHHKFMTTRYSSLQIKESNLKDSVRESGNVSQMSLQREPSKRQVNVNPLLAS
mmetsp:Transcript_38260/g.50184  ORF Transcript_38260/g.50184 Transcript_38260/m.50184 type:complete len:113 (+) Transcript_38260:1337-1675(+)